FALPLQSLPERKLIVGNAVMVSKFSWLWGEREASPRRPIRPGVSDGYQHSLRPCHCAARTGLILAHSRAAAFGSSRGSAAVLRHSLVVVCLGGPARWSGPHATPPHPATLSECLHPCRPEGGPWPVRRRET